jgi:hypothetical protein
MFIQHSLGEESFVGGATVGVVIRCVEQSTSIPTMTIQSVPANHLARFL